MNGLFFTISFSIISASINAIACPLGGLLCSYILDKYGRKKTLYMINAISILSWALMALASTTDKKTMFCQLLVARLLIGKQIKILQQHLVI